MFSEIPAAPVLVASCDPSLLLSLSLAIRDRRRNPSSGFGLMRLSPIAGDEETRSFKHFLKPPRLLSSWPLAIRLSCSPCLLRSVTAAAIRAADLA